jgi:RNA recognition motif-containing protein
VKIFISNLHFSITESDLRWHLEQTYGGSVYECILATDREGKSKGFAFADMEHTAGLAAIAELDGKKVLGRKLSVRESTPCHKQNDWRPATPQGIVNHEKM